VLHVNDDVDGRKHCKPETLHVHHVATHGRTQAKAGTLRSEAIKAGCELCDVLIMIRVHGRESGRWWLLRTAIKRVLHLQQLV
jgi:hypothetical protein